MNLTEKQKKVVEILARRVRRGREAPTYRELADELGVTVRAAFQHIAALEKQGVVMRLEGRKGFELAREYQPEPGLPVLGRVAAGLPLMAEENIEDRVDLRSMFQTDHDDDMFLLKVRGDSMEDKHLFEGDFVLVRPQLSLSAGEIGVVSINGEITVKEVHQQRGQIFLISHNRARGYRPQIYGPRDQVRIVGKVMMAFRLF